MQCTYFDLNAHQADCWVVEGFSVQIDTSVQRAGSNIFISDRRAYLSQQARQPLFLKCTIASCSAQHVTYANFDSRIKEGRGAKVIRTQNELLNRTEKPSRRADTVGCTELLFSARGMALLAQLLGDVATITYSVPPDGRKCDSEPELGQRQESLRHVLDKSFGKIVKVSLVLLLFCPYCVKCIRWTHRGAERRTCFQDLKDMVKILQPFVPTMKTHPSEKTKHVNEAIYTTSVCIFVRQTVETENDHTLEHPVDLACCVLLRCLTETLPPLRARATCL